MEQIKSYYNKYSKEYIDSTINCDMSNIYSFFEKHLNKNTKTILDIGFGSGRDMLYFKDKGYDVYGIDPTIEFVNNAKELELDNIKCLKVEKLDYNNKFDAIWACASLLHVNKKDNNAVFKRCYKALKDNGIMYCSFKYGDCEIIKDDRYFLYVNEKSIKEYIKDINLNIIDECITTDVRIGRENKKWYNCIIKK